LQLKFEVLLQHMVEGLQFLFLHHSVWFTILTV